MSTKSKPIKGSHIIDDKLLPWVWAYREQLYLMDNNDAVWIDAAQNSWPDETLFNFLSSYGLIRGEAAKLFQKNNKLGRAKFQQRCEPLFKPKLPKSGKTNELQNRWNRAFTKVGTLASQPNSGTLNLRSATSKMLWFYQPKDMVMYDRYAREGLAQWARDHDPNIKYLNEVNGISYLACFDRYYDNHAKSQVFQAEQLFGRQYPYPRRVAEKRLWLKGSGNEDKLLAALKQGLKKARIVTAL